MAAVIPMEWSVYPELCTVCNHLCCHTDDNEDGGSSPTRYHNLFASTSSIDIILDSDTFGAFSDDSSSDNSSLESFCPKRKKRKRQTNGVKKNISKGVPKPKRKKK